jgi:hypothetical protein
MRHAAYVKCECQTSLTGLGTFVYVVLPLLFLGALLAWCVVHHCGAKGKRGRAGFSGVNQEEGDMEMASGANIVADAVRRASVGFDMKPKGNGILGKKKSGHEPGLSSVSRMDDDALALDELDLEVAKNDNDDGEDSEGGDDGVVTGETDDTDFHV